MNIRIESNFNFSVSFIQYAPNRNPAIPRLCTKY